MGAAKELAERLNGMEYRKFKLPDTELNFAENYNLIVLYGSGDDCIEMEGVFTDEISYYDQEKTFTIDNDGVIPEWDEDYDMQEAMDHVDRLRSAVGKVTIVAESLDNPPFLTLSAGNGAVEVASFELHFDGEMHSNGLVLDISGWDKSDTLVISASDDGSRSKQAEISAYVQRLPDGQRSKVVRLVSELRQRVEAEPELSKAIEFIGLEKGLYGPPNGTVQLG